MLFVVYHDWHGAALLPPTKPQQTCYLLRMQEVGEDLARSTRALLLERLQLHNGFRITRRDSVSDQDLHASQLCMFSCA